MITTDHLFLDFDNIFVFTEDVAKIHTVAAKFNDKFDLYEWAASEKRSIIRQFIDSSIEYGLFEPIPHGYFVAILTPWDINSRYFVQTFKTQKDERKN